MSKCETVGESWESFKQAVMPADAPADQRREMRRAFYAGAWGMLCNLGRLGEHDVTEDEGVKELERLKAECRAFTKDLLEGRA